ncbi:hypothetical protein ACWC10_06100 [Streptomyces sp. NPDC001595]|uniref:hypothetical protein n=1 Tax=Streptomyces sp. NPDC001532 TaxID=3154520 RepID=UPI00332DEDEA
MTYWEVAVPFTASHGGQGTHYFIYFLGTCPDLDAAARAATVDALSADAVRHRGGAEIEAHRSTAVLRMPAFGFGRA